MKPKKLSKEEYITDFCREKRIRDRYAIYVSKRSHEKIMRNVKLFRDNYITASSLADRIIEHHFHSNLELLKELEKEDDRIY